MGLKVGEMFVDLTIKGTDVSVRAIAGVKTGLEQATESGLALKAAILAALYGLDRFTTGAGKRGMELEQFANFTGLSAQKLQQWQYAMRISGVEAATTQQSIQSLQGALMKMSLGQGAPGGMDQVSKVLAQHGVFLDKTKWKDAFYFMDRLREYAKFEKNPALANQMLGTFIPDPGMIQALRAGKIDPNKVGSNKILSQKDFGNLSEVNKMMVDFHNNLELFGQKFIAKHGVNAIKEIGESTKEILKLVESLTVLAEKIKVFDLINTIFKGLSMYAQSLNNSVDQLSGSADYKSDREKGKGGMMQFWKDAAMRDVDTVKGLIKGASIPSTGPNPVNNKNNTNQNIKVDVHNHGVKDMHEGAHHVKKAVQGAFYQLQSQTMVT